MPLFADQQDFSALQLKNLGDPINDLIKIIVENLCPFNTAQIIWCSAPGASMPAFLGITTDNVTEGITRKVKKNARSPQNRHSRESGSLEQTDFTIIALPFIPHKMRGGNDLKENISTFYETGKFELFAAFRR